MRCRTSEVCDKVSVVVGKVTVGTVVDVLITCKRDANRCAGYGKTIAVVCKHVLNHILKKLLWCVRCDNTKLLAIIMTTKKTLAIV